MTEILNPRLAPFVQSRVGPKVDWSQAPPLAAAYIAIHVAGETHGCWVLDSEGGRRVKAPDFGITELLAGQSFIMRRPGSLDTPAILDILHGLFWQLQGFNDKLLILPPEDGYVRPKALHPNRLSLAVEVALEPA